MTKFVVKFFSVFDEIYTALKFFFCSLNFCTALKFDSNFFYIVQFEFVSDKICSLKFFFFHFSFQLNPNLKTAVSVYFVSIVFNFLNTAVYVSVEFKVLDCSFCVFKHFLNCSLLN